MKKGFTMIELIFVIVILGILAAVAIPRLAATRDDAKLAAVKTDIGTFMNAVPAWYQGQKDARIAEAVSIDTNQWEKNATTPAREEYILTLDDVECVTIAVYDINSSGTSIIATQGADAADVQIDPNTGEWNSSTGGTVTDGTPVFRVIKPTASPTGICGTLWNDLGVTEANITMAGKKVKW